MYWANKQKAFKSQHTQFQTKLAQTESEIKASLDSDAPRRKRNLDCVVLHNSCKRKIVILEGYLTKLAELATLAPDWDDADNVEAKLNQLDHFQEMVTAANTHHNFIGTNLK